MNPLTGEPERPLSPVPPEELAATALSLRSRSAAWRGADRGAALSAFGAAIARDERLLAALVADTGRHAESELERRAVAAVIDRWVRQAPALLADRPEEPASVPGIVVGGEAVPYELVGAISPWNFPLLLGLIDAVPALAAGCAVLVKPSELTPRFVEPLMRLVPPELPLHVVEGDARTGKALVGLVDALVFTGGVATGRKVAEAAARAFIPAFLELGGKDPAIVLAGADLDRAATAILRGGTANAGQACQSIERVYVAREVFADFLALLVDKAKATRLTCEGGPVGPLIRTGVIPSHLAEAVERGAVVHTGGQLERHGGGHWMRPTVLTGVDHSMRVMTEETFGPVLPLMPFDGVDEAVALANDSVYGLSAAVFAATEDEARQVASRLRVGAVSVNDAALTAFVHEGDKHSFNLSGLGGSRMGPAALNRFVRRRAHLVNRSSRSVWSV
ncbi:aldehyde dehydrogenase family protein [Nonomuraea sp. NPDC059194]|uniref:aldehyde dehydrogenase family protein n=1 Tax=Nonomuraea sp. NPDC059194 TaxID=3346764 RepID=UPI0036B93F59